MTNAVMAIEGKNTIVFVILALSNIAQGMAALMFTIIHRHKSKTKQVGIGATTSAWLGVTEPAMYGINIRYLSPFIGAIIGSSLGAFFIVLSGVSASGIGNGGLLAILSINAQSTLPGYNTWAGTGYLWFTVATLITISVTAISTVFLRKIPRLAKLEKTVGVL